MRIRSANRQSRASPSTGRKTPENSADYFGHPWAEWFEMCDAGRDLILERARQGRPITYPDLWSGISQRLDRDIGHPWRQIPLLLEYISDRTYEDLGLFLTALVNDPDKEGPTEGFFRLAAARGALPEKDSPEMGKPWRGMTPAQRTFWQDQERKLFELLAPSADSDSP